MNQLELIISLVAGIALGAFYFGSLWWVVSHIPKTHLPELWIIASYFIRTSVVLVGFYFVMDGQWERLVVCVVGFLVARSVLVRLLRPLPNTKPHEA